MSLSPESLILLNEFIEKNSPVDPEQILGCINYGNLREGREIYKLMRENEPINGIIRDFIIFGEEGMGYTSYSLYKSPEDKIYCVRAAFISGKFSLCAYAVIESSEPFDKYFIPYDR